MLITLAYRREVTKSCATTVAGPIKVVMSVFKVGADFTEVRVNLGADFIMARLHHGADFT